MKGGPTYKILMLKKHLEKFNIIIDLFNQWEVDSVKNYDIVHIFNAHSGVYHFAQSLKWAKHHNVNLRHINEVSIEEQKDLGLL